MTSEFKIRIKKSPNFTTLWKFVKFVEIHFITPLITANVRIRTTLATVQKKIPIEWEQWVVEYCDSDTGDWEGSEAAGDS